MEDKKNPNSDRMAMTPANFILFAAGLAIMILGYVLMAGGGSKDPQVFNEAMFDFRRIVLAPTVIVVGVIVEVVAIMGWVRKSKKK